MHYVMLRKCNMYLSSLHYMSHRLSRLRTLVHRVIEGQGYPSIVKVVGLTENTRYFTYYYVLLTIKLGVPTT